MKQVNRRTFISQSAAGAAGAALGVASLPSHAAGANDRPRFALIGCGGRGGYVARTMVDQGAECVYLCDLHPGRRAQTAEFLSEVQPRKPVQTGEMREAFDAADVDFVVVATPDHWHAPATVAACLAGKDVYVEKPHSVTIWESRRMIEAARKTGRIIQVGTQNRSAPYTQAAREAVKSGRIGDVHLVKVFNLKPGGAFRLGPAGTQPEGFDWDAWLGVAPARPYHQRIFSSGWHHFWDFSGGDLCDDAVHQADLALMLMGDPGMPTAVSCSGGRLHHQDDSQVPDLQVAACDFDGFVLTLEHSNYPRYMRKTSGTIRRNDELPYWTQNATRVELYGSELLMIVGRHGGGWVTMTSGGKLVDKVYGRAGDAPHDANFLACIRDRKKPTAAIDVAHPAACMIHMANIAHRVGNVKLRFDAEREEFLDNDAANKLVRRADRAPYGLPDLS